MLKQIGIWATPTPHSLSVSPTHGPNLCNHSLISNNVTSAISTSRLAAQNLMIARRAVWSKSRCGASRRRVRYEEDDDHDDEEYGHNQEIAMLESYSESARGEALLVHACVDEEEVQVLIFKGFSSCLSNATSPDPSRSILPARAVIKLIDRIEGPFDPSNIEYIEKALTWENFKSTKGKMAEVRLHGSWASPASLMAQLALKIKGIPYEYVEEDLCNDKSPSAYKKIPVLIHRGKPISESMIILEYIDETWKNAPPVLMPQDPYQRARVRFWAGFLRNQLFEATRKVIKTDGEAQEKATQEVLQLMKEMEHGVVRDFFPYGYGIHNNDGKNLGFLDILMIASFACYKAYEEVSGVKLLIPKENPFIYKWVTSLKELPLVQELLPPHQKLVAMLRNVRKETLKPSTQLCL